VGCISWRNRPVFLSEALAGETVAFEEIDDGLWTVYVASIALARFDERRGRVDPIAGDTAGRSPTTSARASLKP
jgi:hypothetical protein